MSLLNIFNISGSGMSAQSHRLNITASNMANAGNTAGKAEDVYRAKEPVFEAMMNEFDGENVGVRMTNILESNAEALKRFEPNNPLADEEGYVYSSNVNVIEQMANMISASRSYQNNIEVMNTSKQLLMNTLNIGR